jgi:hypothetical protein
MDTLDELLMLERRGWDALCGTTGADFYGEIMTEDGVMVLSNGMVLPRSGVVESLRSAPPWASYAIADVRLIELAAHAAALVYRGSARREGDEPAFEALMSSTYVRRDGAWRLALCQQTPIPAG